jgi:gas vesicle protein
MEKESNMKTHTHEHTHENEDFEDTVHETSATKSDLTVLLVGGAIGAATALLFAPRPGEETRAEIRDKAMEIRDRTTETVKDTVSQAKSTAYQIKDDVREKAQELKERGQQVLNKQLERVSQAAEDGKKKVQEY